MKKSLFAAVVLMGFISHSFAQVCTPSGAVCSIPPGGAVCTNPSPHLDTYQNSPVDTVLYFVFTKQITNPLTATITSVKVTGISNVPVGLQAQLTPDSTFLPSPAFPSVGPIGCVRIVGTPTQVNQISDSVRIDLSVTLQTPFGTMPYPQTAGYRVAVLLPTALDNFLAFGKFDLYPNPANSASKITYTLNQPSRVSLTVHDLQGRLVENVFTGAQTGGYQEMTISTANLTPGLYNVMLQVEDQIITKKLIVE